MKKNMGSIDRIIRIVIGVAIIVVVGIIMQSWWGLVGIAPITTGLLNFCPAYNLIGVNTKTKIETEKLKL